MRTVTVPNERLLRRLGYALRDGDIGKEAATRAHLALRAATMPKAEREEFLAAVDAVQPAKVRGMAQTEPVVEETLADLIARYPAMTNEVARMAVRMAIASAITNEVAKKAILSALAPKPMLALPAPAKLVKRVKVAPEAPEATISA
jgi:hypothetical protein